MKEDITTQYYVISYLVLLLLANKENFFLNKIYKNSKTFLKLGCPAPLENCWGSPDTLGCHRRHAYITLTQYLFLE
jgi:hypothetical protein